MPIHSMAPCPLSVGFYFSSLETCQYLAGDKSEITQFLCLHMSDNLSIVQETLFPHRTNSIPDHANKTQHECKH